MIVAAKSVGSDDTGMIRIWEGHADDTPRPFEQQPGIKPQIEPIAHILHPGIVARSEPAEIALPDPLLDRADLSDGHSRRSLRSQ